MSEISLYILLLPRTISSQLDAVEWLINIWKKYSLKDSNYDRWMDFSKRDLRQKERRMTPCIQDTKRYERERLT